MPQFSRRSLDRLDTCHPALRTLMHAAIRHVDFTVLCGIRTDEEQAELFRQGRSQLDGASKRSKHQARPDGYSWAVDVAPCPIDWQNAARFTHLAGFIRGLAAASGIEVRWGGDWDGDGELTDNRWNDLPHIELVKP